MNSPTGYARAHTYAHVYVRTRAHAQTITQALATLADAALFTYALAHAAACVVTSLMALHAWVYARHPSRPAAVCGLL